MKNKLLKIVPIVLLIVFILSPVLALAQGNSSGGCTLPTKKTVGDLLAHVTCLIYKTVVPLLFALAVGLFLWGVVQYVINEADEGKRDKGKQFMLWGLIGLTVMVSVWALVAILGGTFGIQTNVIPQAPQ